MFFQNRSLIHRRLYTTSVQSSPEFVIIAMRDKNEIYAQSGPSPQGCGVTRGNRAHLVGDALPLDRNVEYCMARRSRGIHFFGNYILDCMVGGALKQSKGKWHSLNVFYLFNNHRSRAYPFPQHETLSRVPGLYPM